MNTFGRFLLLFLALNFLALFLGSQFTNSGVTSDWYFTLNKAPWTPPGWVFGAAWTTIMICYAIFMAKWYQQVEDKKEVLTLYAIQWVLNVVWNPLFFHFRWVEVALVSIISLLVVVIISFRKSSSHIGMHKYWISPYIIWLFIATSLNAYILLNN